MTLRVVLADDQPLARRRLARLMGAEPDVEVVAACANGREAVTAIRSHLPDVAYLDVEMPGLDAFEVAQELAAQPLPALVLVTAHSGYAVRAFEANVVDYLLKPVTRDRVRASLERVRARRGTMDAPTLDRMLTMLSRISQRVDQTPSRIVVRTKEKAFFLNVDAIDWIEAAGKQSRVHMGKHTHMVRTTLADLERSLDPERFVRISRSAIVNVDRIQEIQPWFQREHVILLRDGSQITSSRRFRANLRRLLGK
ncbi:MAG TPA: LytTR family DNA-binding domain-containing protein [Gemmatimonadales bacterium]|nr:LytTR family DNA-binding domain-containing protein [Gemmatimonadales bacterium]